MCNKVDISWRRKSGLPPGEAAVHFIDFEEADSSDGLPVSHPLLTLSGQQTNYAFLAFSTIALKASGLFIARSASTLRLISMPAL